MQLIKELDYRQTGFIVSTNIFRVGAKAKLHPNTLFFPTKEQLLQNAGELSPDAQLLSVEGLQDGDVLCELPPPGTKIPAVHKGGWIDREGPRVLFVHQRKLYIRVPAAYR